jgi:hypothetical protein
MIMSCLIYRALEPQVLEVGHARLVCRVYLLLTGRAAIGEIPVRTSGKDQIDPKPPAALGSMPLLVPAYGAAKVLLRDSRAYT